MTRSEPPPREGMKSSGSRQTHVESQCGVAPSALTDQGGGPLEAFLSAETRYGTPGCNNPDCREYPYYGVAPHECFYKKGREYTIGQSTMLPRDQWPANFILDLEPGEDPALVAYPSACGVYYCPSCMAGMPDQSVSEADDAALRPDDRLADPLQTDPSGQERTN